ncbi:unnamed protein product [Lathyrus sativus]|nr:unnamed protein product [Lathyrus sativus]
MLDFLPYDNFIFTECSNLLHCFVNRSHWVQVNIKEGFSLPPVIVDWKKFHSPAATSWMLGFARCLQHWQQLTPILPTHYKL